MNRSKLVAGAVLVAVVIALLLLILSLNSPSCQYTDKEPQVDLRNKDLLKNLDSNALVELAGYIKYNSDTNGAPGPEKVYLPLNVTRIQVDEEDAGNVTVALSMKSDCFNFGIKFPKHDVIDTCNVWLLSLQFTTPGGDQARCHLLNPRGLYFLYGLHYKCRQERIYSCYAEEKDPKIEGPLVATLVLKVFEFEVGAKPDDVKAGRFSTPGTEECPS